MLFRSYEDDPGNVTIRAFVRACLYNETRGLVKRWGFLPSSSRFRRALFVLLSRYLKTLGIKETRAAFAFSLLLRLYKANVAGFLLHIETPEAVDLLKKLNSRARTLPMARALYQIESDKIKKEIERLTSEENEAERPPEGHFIKSVQIINKALKTSLDYNKSTLLEFLSCYELYREEQKRWQRNTR